MEKPKVVKSKNSFFRLDPEYEPKTYDTSKKVLPPSSQEQSNTDKELHPLLSIIETSIDFEVEPNVAQEECPTQLQIDKVQQEKTIDYKTCLFCSKTFKSKGGMKIHMNKCKLNNTSNLTHRENSSKLYNGLQTSENTTVLSDKNSLKVWGNQTIEEVKVNINNIYNEIVLWRKNIFKVPSGKSGKTFIQEMTRLIELWTNKSTLFETISIKALMIMPALLLQKPSSRSTAKEHSEYLKKRLIWWENGEFSKLMDECRAVQTRLNNSKHAITPADLAKRFSKLIFEGKIRAALSLLENQSNGNVLPLKNEVLNQLKDKYPAQSSLF